MEKLRFCQGRKWGNYLPTLHHENTEYMNKNLWYSISERGRFLKRKKTCWNSHWQKATIKFAPWTGSWPNKHRSFQWLTTVLFLFFLMVIHSGCVLTSFMPRSCSLNFGLVTLGSTHPLRLSGRNFCCSSCAYRQRVNLTYSRAGV